MTKQTSIEWLVNELKKSKHYQQMINEVHQNSTVAIDVIQQANQMHKEEIEDAHIEGQRVFDKHPHTQWTNDQAEQYYNETYGK
jgi:hypothetical protein